MKSVTSAPVSHVPSCKISGRLIPAYDFLPQLKNLCLSLGFNNPIISRSAKLVPHPQKSLSGISPGSFSGPHEILDQRDHIIILSTMVPYDQSWGGFSGLPGQHFGEKLGAGIGVTPSDFILPYLKRYQFAQTHMRLGCDSTGKFLVTLPESLLSSDEGDDGITLRVIVEKIAEPNMKGQLDPLVVSGSFVTFPLAVHLRESMDDKKISWQPGRFIPIGEHLTPELFHFLSPSAPDSNASPFSTMLLPMMPWIVTHRTPYLAATLIHLQTNFLREHETFVATGPNDLRNLLCVAGLDIDMRGFRGRKEHYFVPWQACWKRHGYCYDNIYPLLQDDLFVALMNFNRVETDAENCSLYS